MHGPFFVASFENDMNVVEQLLKRDYYSGRFKEPRTPDSRPLF